MPILKKSINTLLSLLLGQFAPSKNYTCQMKLKLLSSTVGVVLLLQGSTVSAKHSHNVLDRRHRNHVRESKKHVENELDLRTTNIEARGGQCQFPTDAGLVAITPDQQNAGWAMSPNQPCLPNNYCPYACPSGQMMAQWNPQATSYEYPQSMVGNLIRAYMIQINVA